MSLADLDDEVRAFIAKSESFYPASANEASPAENRTIYDRMCAAFDRPRPPGLVVTDETLSATDPARTLPIRRYRPPSAPRGRLVLYFHGGGFVVGGLHSHDGVCAELAAASEHELVALDYRLAPEHLYPAALDDAEAAYLSLHSTAQRIVVAGDSAGGNLAAALCLRLRRKGLPLPVGQVLIYPGLHPKAGRAEGTWRADVPMLRASDILVYRRLYTGQDASDTKDAELAPLAAKDFAGLPPAAIFAADIDPLAEDAADYAAALRAAGGAATLDPGIGLVHGHLRGRHSSARIKRNFSEIAAALHSLCA
ncbi:alpha/beta hydrolase fold domain-containing protein [Acidisoma sp. L85]|uniref:alpha/beta hydrolase fold domain-containing protein n=1 Tax=Acidisoma sp. L85 TaxID=1641850 RepID=UPI00131E24A4|nr:alpha/beta hydrolase [Acidisoma sp. L85]